MQVQAKLPCKHTTCSLDTLNQEQKTAVFTVTTCDKQSGCTLSVLGTQGNVDAAKLHAHAG